MLCLTRKATNKTIDMQTHDAAVGILEKQLVIENGNGLCMFT